MRITVQAILLSALLSTPMALAQDAPENVVYYSTSVEPAEYVFDQEAFARDENGDRIRDEDGRYVLERQFVTLTVEARMNCAVPPDGEEIAILASGPRINIKDAETQEVLTTYLDLEPRQFNLSWQQDESLGEWVAEAVMEIDIISNGRPESTLEGNFTWYVEQVDIPEACPQQAQDPNVQSHIIIIPGDDAEPTGGSPDRDTDGDDIPDSDDDDIDGDGVMNDKDGDIDGDGIANAEDPDRYTPASGIGTPAPGTVVLLGLIGLATALRRRF